MVFESVFLNRQRARRQEACLTFVHTSEPSIMNYLNMQNYLAYTPFEFISIRRGLSISVSVTLSFASIFISHSFADPTPEVSPVEHTPKAQPNAEFKRAHEAHVVHIKPDGGPQFTNELINSGSTYLRQHAHQPVQWRAWSDQVLKEAKRDGRLIFLSVGYATCHWCHVMAKESFEDLEIAKILNESFIPIKVDRQERPDIDDIYMKAVRALSRRGGWPMTVILTPDAEPFFGGTYFPPRDGVRGSRRGLLSILKETIESYRKDPKGVVENARNITAKIKQMAAPPQGRRPPNERAIIKATQNIARRFDKRNGGFGRAPKFPRPVTLRFLLRYGRRAQDDSALYIVGETLDAMRKGGIWDHVGRGFHRYSVDARWRVPHFEKMLYDNAQLAITYLEAWRASEPVSHLKDSGEDGAHRWREVTVDILDYLIKEMRHPSGALYAATDADSLSPEGEGVEGYFFTWTLDELKRLLTPEETRLWRRRYNVGRGALEGRDVLYTNQPISQTARALKLTIKEVVETLDQARSKLYRARAQRPAPTLDAQVVTGWSALALSAFAQTGWALDRSDYIDVAKEIARALTETMRAPSGRLWRVNDLQGPRGEGMLIDYAATVSGLLDLYEATADPQWLAHAQDLQRKQDELFWDAKAKVYQMAPLSSDSLVARPFPEGDYAVPAGVSIAAQTLTRWTALSPGGGYEARLRELMTSFERVMSYEGSGWPHMMSALDAMLDRHLELIIVAPNLESASALEATLKPLYLPQVTRVVLTPSTQTALHRLIPEIIAGKVSLGGKATAYVCESGACQAPTTDPKTLKRSLMEVRRLTNDPLSSLYSVTQ